MSKISLKHSGGKVVSLNSPTTEPNANDVAFKLPNADGSAGQFMKTDGSGNLSFGAAGGGKILQVVEHTFSDETQSTSTSYIDVTGSSKALTLSNSSNKVLIQASIYLRHYKAYAGQGISLKIQKTVSGSTSDIYDPVQSGIMFFTDTSQLSGHDIRGFQTLFNLDTPGNTSVTYKIQCRGYTSSNNASWAVNRPAGGTASISKIIFMEIAA